MNAQTDTVYFIWMIHDGLEGESSASKLNLDIASMNLLASGCDCACSVTAAAFRCNILGDRVRGIAREAKTGRGEAFTSGVEEFA